MSDLRERLTAALADRYTIEREIGSGGMATVYLAHDYRHDRQVAVKLLRPDLAATLGPERFLREIKIAAQLQHPNILPLLDSGDADGFLYYVMPFVEGQSLRDKLAKEGELPIGDAVRILRDVVDALTEAHANGVVHRDIKPENILLRGRHALVTDFGVAKAVSEATGREQLTTAGVALGTPAYMAPEQASADPHLDHRVDIYAVGAVAYELLTGRPVFWGTTPQMILSAHMTEAPQPVAKHRDTVPAALEAVVMRCLEKKPADRFQSAEELLPQLEVLTTPSGGMTPTGTMPTRASRFLGSAKFTRTVTAAIVVAVVVAGWWLLKDRGESRADGGEDAIPIAVLSFETRNAGDDADAFSEGLAEDVATQLTKIRGLMVKAPAASRGVSTDTMSYGQIGTTLGARYLVHGSWERAGDELRVTARLIVPETDAQVWAEDYQRPWSATGILTLRSEVARHVATELGLQLTAEEQAELAAQPTASTEAYTAYQLGRFFWNKRGSQNLTRAIEYFEQAVAADSAFARAFAGMAETYAMLTVYPGDLDVAVTSAKAEAAAVRALAIDSTLGQAYTALAWVRWVSKNLPEATTAFRHAVALSPTYATAHHWYGVYLVWLGRMEEGVLELRRARELDPISPVITGNFVEALGAAGRMDEAVEECDRLRALGSDLAWVANLPGVVYVTAGRLDEALAFYEGTAADARSSAFRVVGLMQTYARMGDQATVHTLYQQHEQHLGLYFRAEGSLLVGDTNRAFDLLAQAAEHESLMLIDTRLRFGPFAGLWTDHRFRDVMRAFGFDVVNGMVIPFGEEPGSTEGR